MKECDKQKIISRELHLSYLMMIGTLLLRQKIRKRLMPNIKMRARLCVCLCMYVFIYITKVVGKVCAHWPKHVTLNYSPK
jgi:hypothetical protein